MASRKKTLASTENVLRIYARLYALDGDWRAFEKAFPKHKPDAELVNAAATERAKWLEER